MFRHHGRERGAALVEFALILPILLMLVLGIIEFGWRYAKASQLNNFAYIGARDVSIHDAISGDVVTKVANATNPDAVPVIVTACPTDPPPGSNAVVEINTEQNVLTGFFNWLPGEGDGTFTINARGVARCDG